MVERELTEAAQDDREMFEAHYHGEGCTCFISPPCSWCLHPGNPRNQEEDDECWMPAEPEKAAFDIMKSIREMVG
jgi:hypothetical protein